MVKTIGCPACGGSGLEVFFEIRSLPIFCNVLYERPESARAAPTGDIILEVCPGCAMIHNRAFEAERVRYAPGYENSLHGSPRFQSYAENLARGLIQRHRLKGAQVLEVGCGRGEFLELLARLGGCRGLGVDPSASLEERCLDGEAVRVVRQLPPGRPLAPRLVCSRHVLEHVADPLSFLHELVALAGEPGSASFYLEVPNGLWTLRDLGIWDIIYEHCTYFVPSALRALLARVGLEGASIRETFGGQFLAAEVGRKGSAPPKEAGLGPLPAEVIALARRFARRHAETMGSWRARLAPRQPEGGGRAIWGAGSKGITFVNLMGGEPAISWVVDINPLKRGKFTPGTGHQVISPAELSAQPVRQILVMNPLYREEVQATVAALGMEVEVVAV